MDKMAYTEHATCPKYHAMRQGDDNPTGLPLWSGEFNPPAIGETIKISFNRLSTAKVVGYFIEEDYLGLLVVLDNPPNFVVKNNNGDAKEPVHVFGIEFSPM